MGDPNAYKNIVSPWIPEKDPIVLAVYGKFLEELGECSSITSRCLIQGFYEVEPTSLLSNSEALENEIADVFACIEMCINSFDLNRKRMQERVMAKIEHLTKWHQMLREMK